MRIRGRSPKSPKFGVRHIKLIKQVPDPDFRLGGNASVLLRFNEFDAEEFSHESPVRRSFVNDGHGKFRLHRTARDGVGNGRDVILHGHPPRHDALPEDSTGDPPAGPVEVAVVTDANACRDRAATPHRSAG